MATPSVELDAENTNCESLLQVQVVRTIQECAYLRVTVTREVKYCANGDWPGRREGKVANALCMAFKRLDAKWRRIRAQQSESS
eukprot:6192337-Pleurochrysis_carterae.AAC.2